MLSPLDSPSGATNSPLMKDITLSSSSSRTLRHAVAATLLFAIGCTIVPLCEAVKPVAPSPNPSKKVTTTAEPSNPLLKASTLPYQLPPFDKIKDEHFQPALEQGIAE